MSHPAQIEFISKVRLLFSQLFNDSKVLEVGSLDINGSVRSQFQNCEYIGLDIGPGAGVDVVCPGQDYQAPDSSFDAAVSCECMEHNPFWKETFLNMVRVTKPGGMVLMTCATTGRDEHGTARSIPEWSPLTIERGWNYYKNLTASDFRREVDLSTLFQAYMMCINASSSDLYFVGFVAGGSANDSVPKKLAKLKASYTITNSRHPTRFLRYALMRTFGEQRMRRTTRGWRSLIGKSTEADRLFK